MNRISTFVTGAAFAIGMQFTAGAASAQDGVIVGGSSIGGLYYVWAGGWANMIQGALGIPTTVEATGGAVANIQLVNNGDIEVGLTTMGALYAGLRGEGWANGTKFDQVRVLFPAYQSYLQYWTLTESGMKTLADLEGKTYSPGTAGGTAAVEGPKLFELLGIEPGRTVFIGYSDANGQLADGLLDAVAASTGIPAPQITDLQASHDVTVLEIPPEQAKTIADALPYFSTSAIPAGTYNGQDADISALSLWNVFIVNASMPEDRAYELVKATFENQPKLVQVHASAKDTVAENATNIRAPFHPGALRYFQEQGIEIAE